MLTDQYVKRFLAARFGPEWDALTTEQRRAVTVDFRGMLREEYDTPDETMDDFVAEENCHAASVEYRQRIGGGNLESYSRCI